MWIFVALAEITGCAGGSPPENSAVPASSHGRAEPEIFRATSVTEHDRPRPLVTGTEIRLALHDDTITASAGCNELTGRAVITNDKRLIVLDPVTTDKHCGQDLARQEAWLTAFLMAQPSWLRNQDTLVLRTATAEIQLTT
jgi:heat shock protein HslJ